MQKSRQVAATMLVVRLIPEEVMREHRETAAQATWRPVSRITAGVFVLIWVLCATLLVSALLLFRTGPYALFVPDSPFGITL